MPLANVVGKLTLVGNLGGPPKGGISFLESPFQSERKVQQKYKKKSETLFTSGQDIKIVNLCPSFNSL